MARHTTDEGFEVEMDHGPDCTGCDACDPAWAGDLAARLSDPPWWAQTYQEAAREVWLRWVRTAPEPACACHGCRAGTECCGLHRHDGSWHACCS